MSIEKPQQSLSAVESLRIRREELANKTRRLALTFIAVLTGLVNINNLDYVPQSYRQLTSASPKNKFEYVISTLQDENMAVDQTIEYSELELGLDSVVTEFQDQLPPEISPENFKDLLISIALVESGLRNDSRLFSRIPILRESGFENSDNRTAGIMQSDTLHANSEDSYYLGFRAGALRLLQNIDLYSNKNFRTEELEPQAIMRFSVTDYRAGRGSSWRAGIQKALYESGYLENESFDGRVGPETKAALILFFNDPKRIGDFNPEKIEEYVERIEEANNKFVRTWWTITQRLNAYPIIPDVGTITTPVETEILNYNNEPITTEGFTDRVLDIYNLIQTKND